MRGFGGMLAFELGSLEAAPTRAEQRAADGARREPRRRRNPHLAPGDDDPRVGAGRPTGRARHHRRPGAHLGRPRGHRGPEGRPAAGARRRSELGRAEPRLSPAV